MKRIFNIFLLINGILSAQTVPKKYHELANCADSLLKAKQYKASAHCYSDAFKELGWRGLVEDRYKAACAWTMCKRPDSALFNLERIAYRVGYADVERVLNEKRFRRLHSDKRWKTVLAKIQFNADSIAQREAMLSKPLIRKLDSLTREDQKWRHLLIRFENQQVPHDSITRRNIVRKMIETDSLNSIEVRRIFYSIGFPGFDVAGTDGSGKFWLLVQHQDQNPTLQDSILKAMQIEVGKKNASPSNYAYLVDRVKLHFDQLQVYGTQMILNDDKSSYIPQPMADPEHVNERRKSMGMGTIEEYIQLMNRTHFGSLRKDGNNSK